MTDHDHAGQDHAREDHVCAVCQAGGSHEEVEAKMRAKIAEHGWTAFGIIADDDQPGWTYTVGLDHSISHPELLIAGLDQAVAYAIVARLAERVLAGERILPGQRVAGCLAGGYELVAIDILDSGEGAWFNMATWFYDDYDFSALQLVWPDLEGNYPWDEAYEQGYHQCLVGEAP